MFRMTYNEAIAIQESQLDFYCQKFSAEEAARIRDIIKAKTAPCPWDPDEPKKVHEINDLVPRGCEIEAVAYGPCYGNYPDQYHL